MNDKPAMILHIGMHKTGSTALQQYLATHTSALERAGFAYPTSGRHSDQHVILPATLLQGHRTLPDGVSHCAPDVLLAEIQAEVRPGLAVILSSEVFWELLLFDSERFLDMVDGMRQRWRVHVLYFARPGHEKSWSTVKHMAREGHVFSPSVAYRDDLRMTSDAEARLRAEIDDVTRISYSGRDTVLDFLDSLLALRGTAVNRSTDRQAQELLHMARRRRRQLRGQRTNRDFRNPYSAAATLVISESLAQQGVAGPLPGLARLYPPLFRMPMLHWDRAGLPDDAQLSGLVREAAAPGTQVFDEADVRAVQERLESRVVRGLAQAMGCSGDLDTLLGGLSHRLGHGRDLP